MISSDLQIGLLCLLIIFLKGRTKIAFPFGRLEHHTPDAVSFDPLKIDFALVGRYIQYTLIHPSSSFGWDFPTQGFAVCSLLPIWLYNGRRGNGGRALQYAFYSFYPLHMLVLYLIFSLR